MHEIAEYQAVLARQPREHASKAFIMHMVDAARQAGIAPEAFGALVERFNGRATQAVLAEQQAQEADRNARLDRCDQALREKWGDQFASKLRAAQAEMVLRDLPAAEMDLLFDDAAKLTELAKAHEQRTAPKPPTSPAATPSEPAPSNLPQEVAPYARDLSAMASSDAQREHALLMDKFLSMDRADPEYAHLRTHMDRLGQRAWPNGYGAIGDHPAAATPGPLDEPVEPLPVTEGAP